MIVDTREVLHLTMYVLEDSVQAEKLPARQAVISVVTDPASNALITRLARSDLRVGAIAPIPPSCTPTELRLANPQSAYVAMTSDFF